MFSLKLFWSWTSRVLASTRGRACVRDFTLGSAKADDFTLGSAVARDEVLACE